LTTVTFTSSGSWTAPTGVTSVDAACWGESGSAANGVNGSHSGGGPGGGEFAEETTLAVTPGSVYNFTIGAGGTNTATSFPGDSVTVTAHAGASATTQSGAVGGSGSTNSIHNNGGHGGNGASGTNKGGGGGGGSGGSGSAGGNGGTGTTVGGSAGSAGTGTNGGAAGGAGGGPTTVGSDGNAPGGAPGGGGNNGNRSGGNAVAGQITLTYTAPASGTATLAGAGTLTAQGGPAGMATLAGIGTLTAMVAGAGNATLAGAGTLTANATMGAGATLAGTGTLTASGGLPAPAAVNQWAATFYQPSGFGTTPPALQSVVVPLDLAYSVGGGSGTATAGNWLFCLVGMNEQFTTSGYTIGVGDDIHSFWRPGNETTSTWAVSTATALTRASIWYTPNIARTVTNVYVAPDGPFDAITVLVVEIAGLGPWDTVTGINTSYAAAATSLGLALASPPAASFTIACVSGDNDTASQAFAPGGWTALSTVTSTNGVDHTCDSVLTSAFLPSTSMSISVSGTAGSAEDLSGVMLQVEVAGGSPVPASNNPNWPYLKFEAAFGGGFQTPPDQLTWTDLTSRLWSWDETTGVQYQLGQIQATNLDLELDNWDNALASDYPGSPYYSNAVNANMSFQSGISPWTASGTGTVIAQSSAFAYASSPGAVAAYSLQVTPDGSHATPGAISEKVAVSASTAYSASAWFYSAAGYATGAKVAITWYDSGGSVISTATSGALAIPAATWTQVTELNQTSPSNAVTAAVTVEFSGTPSATAFYVAEAALILGASAVSTGLVTTGVPLRIRAAVGTMTGATGTVTANRWYCIQRNAEEWPQQIDPAYRRYVSVTATDIWSAMANTEPTPYRGEVAQDAPYSWYAMDDQPLEGGVQPTSLRNSAPGNTTALTIYAAPGGVTAGDAYTTTGVDATSFSPPPPTIAPSIATYSVAQQQGWMYGDPQASNTTYATQNPVTASPGAAAWQQTGLAGAGGTNGWFMAANDTGLPGLSGGASFELWWNPAFFGSATGWTSPTNSRYDICGQPYSQITLATLATASAPVAILYLDLSGHLYLETFNGSTGTAHAIYSSSDLRSASWHQVILTTDGSNWNCYLDGGLGASVSGTGAGMTSAWTWLVIGADLGSAGGSSLSAAQHMGNVAYSHAIVYPSILPAWRVVARYCAAATGFGLLPAPQTVALSAVLNEKAGTGYTPDGSLFNAGNHDGVSGSGYGSTGSAVVTYSFSGLVTATAGSYTSGPSARAAIAGLGQDTGGIFQGAAIWLSFTGLAPSFTLYTAASADAETAAATVNGSGDSFSSGFGSGASGSGVCQVSGGSGTSPPAGPSALGDTVSQRIERCLYYGKVTYPGRCVDQAPLQVQAATDVGGQQTGINVFNIVSSDGGLMFVDNLGSLTYWQRSHLASQSAVWTIGPGQDPYYREIRWIADPQRVWNAVVLTPFSPDGATLALITPNQAAAVNASQAQYGAQPKPVTSYLQSQAEMQAQANSLFANYGAVHIRTENVKLDAAPDPALWSLVLGINVADLTTMQNWQIGGGGTTWTLRVSEIRRHIEFNGDTGRTEGSVTLKGDFEPTYWA